MFTKIRFQKVSSVNQIMLKPIDIVVWTLKTYIFNGQQDGAVNGRGESGKVLLTFGFINSKHLLQNASIFYTKQQLMWVGMWTLSLVNSNLKLGWYRNKNERLQYFISNSKTELYI